MESAALMTSERFARRVELSSGHCRTVQAVIFVSLFDEGPELPVIPGVLRSDDF
jgi:hypothetical protein